MHHRCVHFEHAYGRRPRDERSLCPGRGIASSNTSALPDPHLRLDSNSLTGFDASAGVTAGYPGY